MSAKISSQESQDPIPLADTLLRNRIDLNFQYNELLARLTSKMKYLDKNILDHPHYREEVQSSCFFESLEESNATQKNLNNLFAQILEKLEPLLG